MSGVPELFMFISSYSASTFIAPREVAEINKFDSSTNWLEMTSKEKVARTQIVYFGSAVKGRFTLRVQVPQTKEVAVHVLANIACCPATGGTIAVWSEPRELECESAKR